VSAVHALIEAQARRTPHRPALAFEGQRLTYAELDRRASALALHLQRLGAGPEVRVGLLLERSLEMVIGILAILKSGAAYVPMDPAYPRQRLACMLADCGARLLLTRGTLVAGLAPGAAAAVRVEEFDWNAHGEAPRSALGPHNLAYVIYTSGSTGQPKGVGIEHRNLANYVRGIAERLELEPGMNHAMVSTVAADLGNTVLFPALATGGCLHVLSQERSANRALLSAYFEQERIDVLKIVPSHLAALQSGADPLSVMPARRLVLGGEASRLEWIERLRAAAPQCRIYNHYGPTETTVGVLTYEVAAGAPLPRTASGTLPLGFALPGSRIHLLDGERRPVAPGEKGELYVGGAGVGRGYLNRPELTAEKFLPDPFSADAHARLYRTGDLARALPDGSLEFCGRIDDQVKLHGYRVELGEIEAALRSLEAVREAAVLARQDPAGDAELVACVATELPAAALREHLKERLPAYMVPCAFVLLERLPLTANGKVDRQALAALAAQRATPARDALAPRTETEKALAALWADLLGVESVGVEDDVFDLGAHSLMAMKALARIREVFGANLALRNLFEQPTIAGLAAAIDALSAVKPRAAAGRGAREEIVL
jgi:amino acid adenylation domain-containing protein